MDAADCGMKVPAEALEAGREFVRRCAVPKDRGGGFAYQAGGGDADPLPERVRACSASNCLESIIQPKPPPAVITSLTTHYLIPIRAFTSTASTTPAGRYKQLGGKYWETGYRKLRDALLAAQNDQGIWPDGSGQEKVAGDALPHQHGGIGVVRSQPAGQAEHDACRDTQEQRARAMKCLNR